MWTTVCPRDKGHVLSKYSGKPNRSFRTHLLVFWRVDISLKPSASSGTRRDATNSLKLLDSESESEDL